MKTKHAQLSFMVLGCCFLAVSFLTGCSFSAEGDGFRIESPSDEFPQESAR